ncbi:hypothetical protein RQP46_008576 [Phenoliferia psychrophenolica]
MSSGGKSGGKAGGDASGGKAQSRSAKAGLQFPVGRIHRLLRKGNYAQRVGAGAPVYLAAVLEYLAAEILELAGNAARDNKKSRIIPRHLQLAIRNDEELNRLLGHVVISQGGVLPNIHSELLPAKTDKVVGGKKGTKEPKVSDWVRGKTFDLNVTDPNTIPTENDVDPVVLPPSRSHPNPAAEISKPGSNFSTPESLLSLATAVQQISAIISANASDTCGACMSGLVVAQTLSFDYPWEVSSLLISLCNTFSPSYGEENYSAQTSGGNIAQVLQFANVTGLDGQMICAKQLPHKFCGVPQVSSYDASLYFNTTEPASKVAPVPSGDVIKVLHLSDFHLDARYTVGSEAECDSYLCCRPGENKTSNATLFSLPAPRFGAFQCDTPYDLAMSAMEAIPVLTGTQGTGFNFTIFTGDLVSHDNDNALSRDYVEYIESVIFTMFKKILGSGPTYAALGNHDSWPQALASLNSLTPQYLADAFSWNYNHLASLWEHFGWIGEDVGQQVRTHYGGYSTVTSGGLRIISLNTDFWYTANLFNYINMTDPDPSGMLTFVASELQRAEDLGQRAWVVGHVLSGWDGSAALPNPSDLWYQIQSRYSPHVLAATFVGHIHDEALYLNYANNGTVKNASTALGATWVGPSLTPLTNLNSGFRMYEVDEKTFDIIDAKTYYSNVSTFAALDGQTEHGPAYNFEYSTREAYGGNITWPASAPLNATWWHRVTEQMEIEPSLVSQFHEYQGRLSVKTGNCTSDACQTAKVCYIRAGSTAQGQACPRGFSSVQ